MLALYVANSTRKADTRGRFRQVTASLQKPRRTQPVERLIRKAKMSLSIVELRLGNPGTLSSLRLYGLNRTRIMSANETNLTLALIRAGEGFDLGTT